MISKSKKDDLQVVKIAVKSIVCLRINDGHMIGFYL